MAVNPGDVDIELNGRTETLRPTPNALLVVNSLGGVQGAYRAIQSYDFNAFVMIIAAGLGKRPSDIQDAVFRGPNDPSGFIEYVEPLIEYVDSLSRGGRPKPKAGEIQSGEA